MSSGIKRLSHEQQTDFLNGLIILSQLFWSPDPVFCREMLEPGFGEELISFQNIIEPDSGPEAAEIKSHLSGYHDPEALFQALEEAYIRLFINAPGGITAPLYQSYYESDQGLLMGPSAKAMRERLLNIGFDVDVSTEPADHLAFEIEYLFLLLEKGLSDGDAVLVERAGSFARDEMLPWVSRFGQRVAKAEANGSFFRHVTGLLVNALTCISG